MSCKFEDIIARGVPFSTSVLDWVYYYTLFVSSDRTAILPLHLCLLFSCSVVCNSVTPWAAAPQPSLSFTRVCSNSCPVSQWCHPDSSNHLILCQLKTKFLPPKEIDTKALWIAPVGNRRCVPWALSPSYANAGWNWNSAPLISKRGWLPAWSVILPLRKYTFMDIKRHWFSIGSHV